MRNVGFQRTALGCPTVVGIMTRLLPILLLAACAAPCEQPALFDPFGLLHPGDVDAARTWIDDWNRMTRTESCATVYIVEGDEAHTRWLNQSPIVELGRNAPDRAVLFEALCAITGWEHGLAHPVLFPETATVTSLQRFSEACAGGPSSWSPLLTELAPLLGTPPDAHNAQGAWLRDHLWSDDTELTPSRVGSVWLPREVVQFHTPDFGPRTTHAVSQGHMLSTGLTDGAVALRIQTPQGSSLNWIGYDASLPIDLEFGLWGALSSPDQPVVTGRLPRPVVWTIDVRDDQLSPPIALGGEATGPATRLGDVLHVPLQSEEDRWGTFVVDLQDGQRRFEPRRHRIDGLLSLDDTAVSYARHANPAHRAGTLEADHLGLLSTQTTIHTTPPITVPGTPALTTAGGDVWLFWEDAGRHRPLVGRVRDGALAIAQLVPRRLPDDAELLQLTSWDGTAMALWRYHDAVGDERRVLWEIAFEDG